MCASDPAQEIELTEKQLHELVGRLRRTTNFVAGTTYASRPEAQKLIDRVANIHEQVRGTMPDGRPYRADDPALLTWVHVTESYGFLEGFRRYSPLALPEGAADAYYDETRRIAEALGARDVPGSEADVAAFFTRVHGQLRLDERSREVLRVLARIRLPVPMGGLSRDLFLGAGTMLLPDWAVRMLEPARFERARAVVAARTLRTLSPMFRVALNDGVAPRACRRVGVDPSMLDRWP